MNINSSRLLWIAALGLVTTSGLTHLTTHYRTQHFSCQNEITVVRNEARLNLVSRFFFDGTKGHFNASGTLNFSDGAPQQVDQSVHFDFWLIKQKLIAVATDENFHSKNIESAPIVLPAFLLHSGNGIALEMIKINSAAYLINKNKMPYFYCKLSNNI